MKKTSIFLTSALIVMAILAGCSDTVAITGLPQNVKSGTINQIGDFLTGQTFDPKKFTVDITYDNGQVITDDGSVTVQLEAGDTVTKGAKVTALLGDDVYGDDVYATGSVAVYDINRIEVTGPASYAKGAEIHETDLTVTAYYYDSEKTEKTMPLATSEFEIVDESKKYANGKGTTPSIPETGATIKIRTTLDGNVVEGLFSYTETYADTTADLPYEIESIKDISYTGQLLALNYDEVPVPALEDVAVTVKGDDGITHDITAADIEGATAQFVDSETHLPLVLTDLVGNTDEKYAVELTWGDVVKYSPATYVTAKKVNLNVEAKPSFALTEGNELGTANADNFTIYYTVEEGPIATVLPSSAVTVAYVADNQSDEVLPADKKIATDPIYVKASYMGEEAWTSVTPGTVTVVPVSVKDIVLTDDAKAAIPAAQYYNSTGWETIEIDNTAIASYTVVFSDGSEVASTETENPLTGNITNGVAYYLDNAGKEPLADVEPVAPTDAAYNADYADTDAASYYDVLADADQIYVQVAYTEGADPDDVTVYGYLAVDLQTAYASSMLAAAEYEFDEPMYGSDITTVVRLANTKGVVDPDFTDYEVLGPDGQPGKIPTTATLVADAAENYTVYAFVKQATGVDVKVEATVSIEPAVDYIKVSKFNIDFTKDAEGEYTAFALIGSAVDDIETTDLAITGWDHAIKEGDAAAPIFTIVAPTTQTVGASTELKANVTYTNEEGDEVTEQIPFTLKGTAYTAPERSGFAFKFGDVVYANGSDLPAGRYSFTLTNLDPESYKENGDDKNFKIESVTVDDVKQSSTTVTVEEGKTVVIAISYTDTTGKVVASPAEISLTVGPADGE